jgi:hypothetical protein
MNLMILQSIITCPQCGTAKSETMPTDACQFFTFARVAENGSSPSEATVASFVPMAQCHAPDTGRVWSFKGCLLLWPKLTQ